VSDEIKQEEMIFHEAVKLTDSVQRDRFLDEACAGNAAVRAGVEKLLAAHEVSEQFFDADGSALTWTVKNLQTSTSAGDSNENPIAELLVDEPSGTRIGRYKILQKIGEGGCGVVYMAEQREPVRRRVALKIIKPGMDTKNVIARFEAERQALALMDHPSIARVLDAGATVNGRPYFVMELVYGVKITEFCNQNHLDTRQRLELFIQICHAIQHAHQKGIIHRDLKPSNVMVTLLDGDPVPKIIDFGIAKATEEQLTDKTLFTIYGHFIGTPAYISPEQAEMSGLDIDTRSDIYSLGVLLYELLTGRTPFDGNKLLRSGLDEMRRTLREKEPQRPSTIITTLQGTELNMTAEHRHVEPLKLISLLRGDLDWIVMKALEKDRRRRYETANGLAMDIQRYLNNEPVVARPPSRLYRLEKLVHRNKVVFAAGASVAMALIIGLSVSTWMFFKEREAERQQTLLRQEAERTSARETELRHQAEIGEKITQAAFAVSQGRLEDADQIIQEISNVPPSQESAAVFRSLGEWHALNGRWKPASERLLTLLQIDQFDGWNITTSDILACGAALAELDDREAYKRYREAAVARFATTPNPVAADRLVKATLLLPAPDSFLQTLKPLSAAIMAQIPAAIFMQPSVRMTWPQNAAANVKIARPLVNDATNIMPNLKLIAMGDARARPYSVSCKGNVNTIQAGGSDIWYNGDNFVFEYLTATNDFDYRLRVHSVTDTDGTGFARSGLMARDSLTDISGHMVIVERNAGPNAGNTDADSFQVTYRVFADQPTTTKSDPPNPLPSAYGSNSWVRLQRSGTRFYAYCSSDGLNWVHLYQFDGATTGDGKFTNSVLYLGIASCAHSLTNDTTAVVSDVSVTPPEPFKVVSQSPINIAWRQGAAASISVTVSGAPVSYQWRKDGVNISGATNATYNVADARQTDAGVYSLLVYNESGSLVTSDTLVTVWTDTDSPIINEVASYDGTSMGVEYNKPMDLASVTNAANYNVSGTTVTNATLSKDGQSVVLSLEHRITNQFVVTVSNLKDLPLNRIAAESKAAGTVLNLQLLAIGDAATMPYSASYDGNLITTVAGGSDILGDSDNLVYQYLAITNDFDFRLRVQSVSGGGGTFARSGLMARDSLQDASSHQVMVAVNAGNTFQLIARTMNGSIQTQSQPPNPLPASFGSNSWVRLQRVGTIFRAYYGDNGVDWALLYQFDSAADADGPFANPIYLGIATSSWSAKKTAQAVVSDFGVTQTTPVSATISLALIEYRRKNYAQSMEWCHRCLAYPDYQAARIATARAILAMCCFQLNQTVEARSELAECRDILRTKFTAGPNSGNVNYGFWVDWVFAQVLLREATDLIRDTR
jgi:eukaryotic-like serine/threonine-protein kinase